MTLKTESTVKKINKTKRQNHQKDNWYAYGRRNKRKRGQIQMINIKDKKIGITAFFVDIKRIKWIL